jgi:hypothetical protein
MAGKRHSANSPPKRHLQAKATKISNVEHAIVSVQIAACTHPYLLFHSVVIELCVPLQFGWGIR